MSTVQTEATNTVARKRRAATSKCALSSQASSPPTNSVARKGRTAPREDAKPSSSSASSKQYRASGAGGLQGSDPQSETAASKVKTATKVVSPSIVETSQSPLSAAPAKAKSSRAAKTGGKLKPRAKVATPPIDVSRAATHSDGQRPNDNHSVLAVAPYASFPMPAEQLEFVQSVYAEWRERQGLVRAITRLSLQAQAALRVGRDKEEAAKNYAIVVKDPMHPEHRIIAPYLAAMAPLSDERDKLEKMLAKSVKRLPIYAWAQGVSGLGDVSLAGLVGECSGMNLETSEWWSIGQMKSVSALWKRMGVAVVGGIRQQRVKGEAAIEHGYVAERRSVLWNIGECIVKAQWRKENTVHAYGKLYGSVKENMQARNEAGDYAEAAHAIAERMKKAGSKSNPENLAGRLTAMHINNRAKRYVTKRLLQDLFIEWRRLDALARGGNAPIAVAA